MTNFDRWRLFTDGFVSPTNYIDFGFYYLISAALQRRVWIGPEHSPLYPNIYVILVGEPGLGKGLVVKQVARILNFHKLDPAANKRFAKNAVTEVDREVMEEVAKLDYNLAQAAEGVVEEKKDKKFKSYEKPLLFPIAADATTYEALVHAMSMALRRINYKKYDEQQKKEVMAIYTHSSLCFCLEEISSLFRKRTEDVVRFLIQAYDCGDYTYDTKTQGKDRVRACCLNFFGGTTPGFMQETFDDKLLTEGFASRTFFIFAAKNRKTAMFVPDLNQEQIEAYKQLIIHTEKLSHLFGRVELEPETIEFLEDWWKNSQDNRPNTSIKLNPYYARKQVHILKVAMALHFGESLEMKIPRETFERAIKIMEREEKNMHLVLGFDYTNPLAKPLRAILSFLEHRGKKTRRELLTEFFDSLPKGVEDLDAILEYLIASNKVSQFNVTNPITKQDVIYYDVARRL